MIEKEKNFEIISVEGEYIFFRLNDNKNQIHVFHRVTKKIAIIPKTSSSFLSRMYIPETKWEENNIITEQEILEAKNLFDQGYSRGLQEGYQQNQAFPKDKNELAGFLKGRLRQ